MRRRASTIVCVVSGLLLTACPPPKSSSSSSGPQSAPPPPPPRVGPGAFADEATVGSQAFFVKLTRLVIGGDFDSWGNEDVEVSITVGGQTRRMYRDSLGLPDGRLETFELADEEWHELAPVSPTEVDLAVRDEDGTDWETIAGTPRPLVLEEPAFGAEAAPRAQQVDLGTIRGTRSGFMVASSSFTIPDAAATLVLVRAPRRDGPDDESRRITRAAFEPVLAAAAPKTAREAGALTKLLLDCQERSARAAPRSTHTWVRRTLPKLRQLAVTAGEQAEAAAAADPDRVRAAVVRVREALVEDAKRGLDPSKRPLGVVGEPAPPGAAAAAEAVAKVEVTEVTPAAMDALAAACVQAMEAWKGQRPTMDVAPGGALFAALAACQKAAQAAKDGQAKLPEAATALARLQAALGPETGK